MALLDFGYFDTLLERATAASTRRSTLSAGCYDRAVTLYGTTRCLCERPIARYRLACVDGEVVLRITHADSVCELAFRSPEATIVLQRLGLVPQPRTTGLES